MRSERIATCTSGDPVSPACIAWLLITSALRPGVIDIGFPYPVEVAVGGRAGMSSSAFTTPICAGQRPRKPGNIAKPVPAPVEIVTARRWREQSAAVDIASFTLRLSSYAAAD